MKNLIRNFSLIRNFTKYQGIAKFLNLCLYARFFFFIGNTFINNARLKLVKIRQKLSNTLRINFSCLKIFVQNVQKASAVILYDYIIWLMIIKIRLKIKNRSQRYWINWPRPRHGHKYTKYKMCLSMMMFICIKQHLGSIWSSIHEKVKQHWGWNEISVAYRKKVCICLRFIDF